LTRSETAKEGSQITLVSVVPLSKNKVVTIALPNATALFLNMSARAWKEAKLLRENSGIDRSRKSQQTFRTYGDAFDYLERVMEAVVTAFSGLEAFVNESIPDDFRYETHRKSKIVLEVMNKTDIERYLSLDEKLASVLPKAVNTKSPKGSRCWSGFRELKKTRDRIIHMKAQDRRSSGPERPTLWHHLFKVGCPHVQARNVVDFFFKEMGARPQWREECPL